MKKLFQLLTANRQNIASILVTIVFSLSSYASNDLLLKDPHFKSHKSTKQNVQYRLIHIPSNEAEIISMTDSRIEMIETYQNQILNYKKLNLSASEVLRRFDLLYIHLHEYGKDLTNIKEIAEHLGFNETIDKQLLRLENSEQKYENNLQNLKILEEVLQSSSIKPDEKRLATILKSEFVQRGSSVTGTKAERRNQLQLEIEGLIKQIFESNKKYRDKLLDLQTHEIKGLDLDLLVKNGSQYSVRLSSPSSIMDILLNSPSGRLRRKVSIASHSLHIHSRGLLEDIFRKRAELAQIYGFESWADYKTSNLMAGNKENVHNFLDQLTSDSKLKFEEEIEDIRKIKAKETKNKNAVIQSWDVFYYANKFRKENFNVDTEAIRDFFPYKTTVRKSLNLIGDLFGFEVEFVNNIKKWHEDVIVVRLTDTKSNELLGHLYLDLLERTDMKREGAFHSSARKSFRLGDKKVRGSSLLSMNLKRNSGFSINDLSYLFHEMGHGIHEMLTQSKFGRIGGTLVERDFVEFPSQFLEEIAKDEIVLQRLASTSNGKNLDLNLVRKIKEAMTWGSAINLRRQIGFAQLDQHVHSKISSTQKFNVRNVTNDIIEKAFLKPPRSTSMVTSFYHILGNGYDSLYYSYEWADEIVLKSLKKWNSLKTETERYEYIQKLRTEIYEKGGMEPATKMCARSFK